MDYLNILACLALGLSLFLTLENFAVLRYTMKISREYLKLMHEEKLSSIKMIFESGNSYSK